jgi:tRNA threonylcarbamoyladenosine biosynthesis protein TsaB
VTEARTLIVGIDTSGQVAGVALARQGVCVASFHSPVGKRARGESLGDALEALLKEVGASPSDLAGIGIVTGPGSYTGLRVGLALARGLAFRDDLPVVGVGTLEVMAEAAAAQGSMDPTQPLLVAVDAGGGTVYVAGYVAGYAAGCEADGLGERLEPSAVAVDDLNALAEGSGLGNACLVGEDPSFIEGLGTALGKPSKAPELAVSGNRADLVCQIAARQLAAGAGQSAEAVLPVYLGGSRARPNRNKVLLTSGVPR